MVIASTLGPPPEIVKHSSASSVLQCEAISGAHSPLCAPKERGTSPKCSHPCLSFPKATSPQFCVWPGCLTRRGYCPHEKADTTELLEHQRIFQGFRLRAPCGRSQCARCSIAADLCVSQC